MQKGKESPGITFPKQLGSLSWASQETWLGERFKSFRRVQQERLENCSHVPVLVVTKMCQTRRGDLFHGSRALQFPAFLLSRLTFSLVTSFFYSQTKFCNALTSAVCLTHAAAQELKQALQPGQNGAREIKSERKGKEGGRTWWLITEWRR